MSCLSVQAFNGSVARSTVRRPASQSAFIKDVGRQTQVVKLQGFLFFGTISAVEGEIRKLLDIAVWQHNPIRFLIVDLWLVYGLDLSAAEAFVRIQRLLEAKGVVLVYVFFLCLFTREPSWLTETFLFVCGFRFCGCHPEGIVGKALQAVELWSDQGNSSVQVVDTLNDALEWAENAYLSVVSYIKSLYGFKLTRSFFFFANHSARPSTVLRIKSRKKDLLLEVSLESLHHLPSSTGI